MLRIKTIDFLNLEPKSKVLAIMPHPDDEAVFCAGLLNMLSTKGHEVHLATLCAGEASTHRHGLKRKDDLGKTREKELSKATEIIGVKLLQERFSDGNFVNEVENIEKRLKTVFEKLKPDLLITLEPNGIYQHPDHVALTETVTSISKFTHTPLLYVTVGKKFKVSNKIRRSVNAKFASKPLSPKIILELSEKVREAKIKSLKAHKSQFGNLKGNDFVKKWEDRGVLYAEYFTFLKNN